MGWWRRVNAVLKKEPETWLAYLYGQKFNDLKHLQEAEPRYQGPVLRLLIHIYTLLRQICLHFTPRVEPVTFLVYAGTRNQLSSLETTVASLREMGQSVVLVLPKSLLPNNAVENKNYQVISLGFFDFFRVLSLTATRLFPVFKSVKALNSELLRKRFDVFLRPHIDLIYFDRLLEYAKPKYVIVSNDHNTPNRSLLALARDRGCKTVYMQHASVSSVFPALNVSYAFLDGMSAYETYSLCEGNQPPANPLLVSRQVVLSGQKKPLLRSKKYRNAELAGLAVNALDNLTDLSQFVQQLTEQNVGLKVRWHPGLGPKNIERLKLELAPYPVHYSDPRAEGVNEFLNSIYALIAGNSSIHLESALCGVPTFYYEISVTDMPDYYGYVKKRLAIHTEDARHLAENLHKAREGSITVNANAVRYYSSTYETEWEGREGALVASALVAVELSGELPTCSGLIKPDTI